VKGKEHFDAVVVGAGPAGSTAALVMARAGLRVALLERGEYPGAKNVSGAVLYGTSFLERLLPGFRLSAPVERYITRRSIGFMSESALFSLDYKSSGADAPPQ
jgi:electron transfer flavoprotein-quinone oxidoreductase